METERLLIRCYKKQDKKFFTSLFVDNLVMKYVEGGVMTCAQAEAFWEKLFAELYPQNYLV